MQNPVFLAPFLKSFPNLNIKNKYEYVNVVNNMAEITPGLHDVVVLDLLPEHVDDQ